MIISGVAEIINLPTFSDNRGHLTPLEKRLPFEIKRLYMIYGVPAEKMRAGHRHKTLWQAAICTHGSVQINVEVRGEKNTFLLDSPDKCLLLKPDDWHTLEHFSEDASLLMLASDYYNVDDYIDTPLPR